MAPLTTLQGRGGGRIPMDGFSYAISRHDLAMLIAQMPDHACRAMHLAVRHGDTATAQRLICEAAATYYSASTPAAPAAALAPQPRTRHMPRPPVRRSRSLTWLLAYLGLISRPWRRRSAHIRR